MKALLFLPLMSCASMPGLQPAEYDYCGDVGPVSVHVQRPASVRVDCATAVEVTSAALTEVPPVSGHWDLFFVWRYIDASFPQGQTDIATRTILVSDRGGVYATTVHEIRHAGGWSHL